LKVTEIVFHDSGCATLVVEMPDTAPFTTEGRPHIPRILFKLLPQMAAQRCVNDEGHSFGREAQATEIPHLFEHLIMEIQNQVRRGVGAPLSGETRWNWAVDPRGRFYVTVDYEHEVVALGAIRLAECLINSLDRRDIAHVDMAREIGRLREIAKLCRRLNAPYTSRRRGVPPHETNPEEDVPKGAAQNSAPSAFPTGDADSAALADCL
jgi:hypothetical protein